MIGQLPRSNVAKLRQNPNLATLEWNQWNEYFLRDFTYYASQLTVIRDLYQWL